MWNVVLSLNQKVVQFFARDVPGLFFFWRRSFIATFSSHTERQLKAIGRKGAAGFSKTVN